MEDKMTSENTTMAHLQDGEPIISEEMIKKYENAVEDSFAKDNPNIITAPNKPGKGGKKPGSLKSSDGKIVTSKTKEVPKAEAPKTQKEEMVALHSTKNVVWENVGKLAKGYNIVSKDKSEKWLSRGHVRLASPDEVAREYGK
jgi:hypothetical protein